MRASRTLITCPMRRWGSFPGCGCLADSDGTILGEARLHEMGRPPEVHGYVKPSRALDDRMSLKIELAAGQKVHTVPFDLKDIPLP